MIWRPSIIWFAALLSFVLALAVQAWSDRQPCERWKAARALHPDSSNGAGDPAAVGFEPCNLLVNDGALPGVCALGGLVSVIGFAICLESDIRRWIVSRRGQTREREQS